MSSEPSETLPPDLGSGQPAGPNAPVMVLVGVAVCALIWGTTWYAITFQLGSVDPTASIVYRFGLAAIILFAICLVARRPIRLTRAQHLAAAGQGVFAFALNTAAYQAEILRGAMESVPKGQWEGAASLGLHKLQTLRKIILPQALIVALRPYGNELILMIKGSAVVAIITVYDLMGMAKLAYSRTFDIQAYIWAAVFYLVIVEMLRHTVEWIERRITIHLKR